MKASKPYPPREFVSVTDHPCTSQVLTPLEVEMTECSNFLLLENLCLKKWTSEAVVAAFSKRTALAEQLLNCATRLLFDSSPGGEGSLVAFRGSPLGPGTDGGG